LLLALSSFLWEAASKKFLGANWKCTLESIEDVDELVNNLNQMWESLSDAEAASVELCVNPPYVFIEHVRQRLVKDIAVGSQNAFDAIGPNKGNTGSCTMPMLRSVGSEWVLLGHSDRRNSLGETNALISDKVQKTLEAGMGVILTMGELKWQRQTFQALSTLRTQLKIAAKGIPADAWGNVVLAYEPVWAIGEGATPCSPKEAQRVSAALRTWIRHNVGDEAAEACRIVYTGSVNEKNAADYAGLDGVDGFVVGRAGLDTTKLKSIIKDLAQAIQ